MPDKTDIEAIARKRGRRFPLTWVAILAVFVAGAGYWFWQGSSSETGTVRYMTTAAAKGDIVVTVAATGTVEPLNTVDISSELSGTVREVLADYNDEVKEGEVLARLDTDNLTANVEHSEASLTAAQANLAQAEITLEEQNAIYKRAQNLAERGISTEETLLQAKASWQRAGAALAALRHLGADEAACEAAVTRAFWPARMQRLTTGPLFDIAPRAELWLDGGHNPAAGQVIGAHLATLPPRPTHLICGMLNTKDVRGYLLPIAPVAQSLTAVSIPGEAATLPAEETARIASAAGHTATTAPDVATALREIAAADPAARVLICGSLYLAGHILRENG